MKFLIYLDFIGIKPVMNISGWNSSKTLFGGILSINLAIVLLLGCGYFINMLISRTTFTVIQSDKFNATQFMNLTNYEMAFYVTDHIGERLNDHDRVVEMTGVFYFWERFVEADGKVIGKMSINPFPLEKCIVNKHFEGSEERWKDETFITESLCLPKDLPLKAYMPYAKTGFSCLEIYIQRCQNSTEKKDCFPKEQIEETLTMVNVLSRFKNIYFNHDKLFDPDESYIVSDAYLSSSYSTKRVSHIFRNVDYDTDDGIFLQQYRRKTYNIP